MEDAVTFLEGLKQKCPNAVLMLDAKQIAALDSDPKASFQGATSNEDFIKLAEAYFSCKYAMEQAKSSLKNALTDPHSTGKKIDVEDQESAIACLKLVTERLMALWQSRLEATEESEGESGLPRVVRLSRRLNLNKKESLTMVFVLVTHVFERSIGRFSRFNANQNMYGSDSLSVCKACDMTITEMIEFLSQDREHMKQGIFPDVQQNYIMSSALSYDDSSFKALLGITLRPNEFLKIEQTPLADIVAEEAGSKHLRSEDGPVEPEPVNKGDAEKEEAVVKVDTAPTDAVPQDAAADMKPKESKDKGEGVGGEEGEGEGKGEEGEGEGKGEGEGEGDAEGQAGMEESDEEIADLDMLLKRERKREKTKEKVALEATEESESSDKLTAYRSDLEYLDDNFQLIAQQLKVKNMESRMEMEAQYDEDMRDLRSIRQKREAQSKSKVLLKRCEKRMELTKEAGPWMPRMERMVQSRGLCEFEKKIVITLIGSVIQPNKITAFDMMGYGPGAGGFSVGDFLRLFCKNLQEQIKYRMYFYKMATLVREGMIIVNNSGLTGDPTTAKVEIDRRMLDFCVGLDTEFSEIVEGSHLYFPKTKFEQVVLSKEQKQFILNTVSNFESFKRCRKKMGLDDAITYGAGMVLLFHGSPGTGKTMMANALANKLSKKILLINFPSLGSMSAGENFKFIFREAKINDAILFFDECEAIFETREKGNRDVNMLLTEIERHDGLIIMATNRPYDLDEAMHRRIMIAIEFRQPDHLLRKAIWGSHIPEQMRLADDVDLNELSLRFELTGGFIKNAILSALSIAVSRDGDAPCICQKDLLQGANLQLRGRLRMKDFDRRLVPSVGLDKVIVAEKLTMSLKEIVQFEKARSILFGQWGFSASNQQQGITVMLHGSPGTGKSLAAEAIGYEVGKPLKVVNCAELLSKWVGESTKNIDAIFEEARHTDAILVFDEAEGLFGSRTAMSTSTDRYANMDVGVLLYHIERFPGIIILTTNVIDNIDQAFFRRLRFVLHFEVPPTKLRAELWKLLIPAETPLDEDVNFDQLATHEMTGGNIKNAVFRAASRAALRMDGKRNVRMEDLEDAAEEEIGKTSTRTNFRRQDSDAARMYN